MQLMPYTAMKIATLVKDDDFDLFDLTRPQVNITYGTYYLDRPAKYYGSNFYVAAAAYKSAGLDFAPHAAAITMPGRKFQISTVVFAFILPTFSANRSAGSGYCTIGTANRWKNRPAAES